ncbi:MAG: 2-succinyl-5-enolpyruvyl-6-hydroxy-3-cyclohexene-1-carboxylate synthase, partial [Actinobacteria bacterium]|nr:2-succinyl-5-enolpyruvyl-6-hydroxy-3-cyclohexene-1-carboxylate synthase [Actinomycetota bacterium]
TTAQVGIFGGAVRAALDLPAGVDPVAVRGHVTRLVAAALGTLSRDPGPVHVNVGFREPLVPPDRWVPGTPPPPVHLAPAPTGEPVAVPSGVRTLVVAGDGAGPVAARVAHAANWPLLAEPTSGSRTGAALTHYQSLLAAGLAEGVERVVVFGHPTLSRPVSALLARPGVVVVGGPRWTDVAGVAAAVVPGIAPPEPTTGDLAWLARWRTADAEAEETWRCSPIERAARAVWERDEVLVIGSSTTIRAFDRAAVPREVRALANRGLAGIDGTVSTAAGLTAGLGEPVRVVLGDLAFLHDAGGLAVGDLEREADLQVVVLDDHGGGIFAGLEHGAQPDADVLARYFTTPQRLDPGGIARAFGAGYARVAVEDLPAALAGPIRGRSVLHVPLSQ